MWKSRIFRRLTVFLAAANFAVPCHAADPRDTESRFGMLEFLSWDHDWNKHHYDLPKVKKAAALMEEAGVAIVRMDFAWMDIEPEQGRLTFEKYDRILDALDKHHIKVLGLLGYNAPWAGEWNSPPDPEAFARYARAVVARYKDRVKYWEVWNEPDVATYWKPQDELKGYSALLRAVYPEIKKEDPTCRVLMGGMSESPSISLKRLYRNGAGDSFDIVNVHPFADPLTPDPAGHMTGICRSVRRVMEANGQGDKPIWITEIGCPSSGSKGKGWWFGISPDEAQQAAWVKKVYEEAPKVLGVEKVFWTFLRDTPDHFGNSVDTFGLVRGDFSKKPAFDAYRRAAKGQK